MRKNLNESRQLVSYIGDSRHDTALEADIDGLTRCLPSLITIAAVASEQDQQAIREAIGSIASCARTLREIADDIFG
jgi:hypothetical protein